MASSSAFDITVDDEQKPLLGKADESDFSADEKDPAKFEHAKTIMRSLKGELASQSFSRRSSRVSTSFTSLIRGAPATQLQPSEALVPLIQGAPPPGTHSRPTPHVKSIPFQAPYLRFARHRAYHLWWLNEFRHWWKSSRLIVRLGGLETYATDSTVWPLLTTADVVSRKGFKHTFKLGKALGQGGVMRPFLQMCQPFTRSIRMIVATWRWIEAAKPRRLEVFVEEALAFMGNRASRIFTRGAVDFFSGSIVLPIVAFLVEHNVLQNRAWHSEVVLIILGIMRSLSPFAASFEGSHIGRILTRGMFVSADHRWLPTQRIDNLNLHSPDCNEPDEVSVNASLIAMAHQVAKVLALEVDHQSDDQMFKKRKSALADIGFHLVGCGSGGYTVFEYRKGSIAVLLHVTPYGPSIVDVMPRYIVLEKEDSVDTRAAWSSLMTEIIFQGPSVIEGYCYQGAFFSPFQFAALKAKYDDELRCYEMACKAMSRAANNSVAKPPTDLASLKAFIEIGRTTSERTKGASRYHHLQSEVDQMAKHIKSMMHQKFEDGTPCCTAPKGVILYFEGLDCAGKSSTGGLVQAALERAGFNVGMRQYNRPPTPEQRLKPWMDRFEPPARVFAPEDLGENKVLQECEGHQHNALVWDRGPAGDFVYGTLASADVQTRLDRYKEFKEFDAQCRRDNILFCKLLFVTDRDAIAATLGKRLAQKKIVRDLHTWLDANHDGEITRDGLMEIELHIDPTDFIAFNAYHKNLMNFAEFARNTDEPLKDTWTLPWIVVSTKNRYPARLQLLREFEKQINTFCVNTETAPFVISDIAAFFGVEIEIEEDELKVADNVDLVGEKYFPRFSLKACFWLFAILCLVFYYFNESKFNDV